MEKQEGERKTTLTFPLISKRLQLHHIQLIARGLCLPTAASAGDLSVMISGRLPENNYDPSNTQVVITQSEKGEELTLQDMDGVLLRIPASECAHHQERHQFPLVSYLLNYKILLFCRKTMAFLLKSAVWNVFLVQ